jgi:hypothetical protein
MEDLKLGDWVELRKNLVRGRIIELGKLDKKGEGQYLFQVTKYPFEGEMNKVREKFNGFYRRKDLRLLWRRTQVIFED